MEIESERSTLDVCRVIHLFQKGTFYRAYEWSAWLCVRYLQDFKPTKRKFKNEDSCVVFIGFPVSSLAKYTSEGVSVKAGEEKSMDLVLPEEAFQEGVEVSLLQSEFDHWKDSVPLVESSKKETDGGISSAAASRPSRLTDIMHRILTYPIEQKSPLESMQFLAEIKRSIADII